jgi:effector-binding domain-containing protein
MIDPPQIVQTAAQTTAVIPLRLKMADMPKFVGPAIGELMKAVAEQDVGPAGPWFIRVLERSTDVIDCEVSVPVRAAVKPTGRVKPNTLPATTVARTIHHGGYEGMPAAWGELDAWVAKSGRKPAANLWDVYVVGPETSKNPADWRTEMNRPLVG